MRFIKFLWERWNARRYRSGSRDLIALTKGISMIQNPVNISISQPAATNVSTTFNVTPTTSSTIALAANANRKQISIFNSGTSRVFIDTDSLCSTTDYCGFLEVGGQFTLDATRNGVYLGDISCILATVDANAKLNIREYT